jgi:hypothetical protein
MVQRTVRRPVVSSQAPPKTSEGQAARPAPRQTAELGRLSQTRRLDEIAQALPLILNSARELSQAAAALDEEHGRSAAVLLLHADEEAAKGLMLLDLIRCPRRKKLERQRLASQVSEHLPRLIYAEAAHWSCADWREVVGVVDHLREGFYLDGPSGVDWVYPNSLIHRRETLLYVDRFRWEGAVEWLAPQAYWPPFRHSAATGLLGALNGVGAFRREGLELIADSWANLDLKPDTHWQEIATRNRATLQRFDDRGWLADATQGDVRRALDWPWPLYDLDLSIRPVDLDAMVAERARYYPG